MKSSRNILVASTAIALLCMIGPPFAAPPVLYDFSTPEAAFRSCGLAIKNDDPRVYYRAIYLGKEVTYDQFLEHVWQAKNELGKKHYFVPSDAVQKSGKIADYFLEAEFLRVKHSEKGEGGEGRSFLVKWRAENVIREETFVRFDKDGDWRWIPDLHSLDISYVLSYATPSKAFRSIGHAQSLRLEGDLCRGLASAARGGMDVEKCAQTLRERLSKFSKAAADAVWIHSMLMTCADCLEEEMFTEKDGSQMCRVWDVQKDNEGKRVRRKYQLFIKEGNEWKWLPDPKSFWNLQNKPDKYTAPLEK